ncbi:MAG: Cytosine-specific methyltransferase [Gemmatimonadetes bacterium]|nr:Cytosine-specific methyltransferase [Gemmatimonadota bacterium]
MTTLRSLEICAGAGGQALGLERAGFGHEAAVEIESIACATLRTNRPSWTVLNQDVRDLNGRDYRGIDLLAGGVPCPPFSVASRQLGAADERDLFPTAIALVKAAEPRAVILENVPGLASARFAPYRAGVRAKLEKLGYVVHWRIANASDAGVPQLRPRFVLVALRAEAARYFVWPTARIAPPTVGQALKDLMAAGRWKGVDAWAARANTIAPTLVGGSKLHGGPDLGPTRAKQAWKALGVDGMGIANAPPDEDFPIDGSPKLTVRMTARIQGFPDSWEIEGKKTAAYRQVGNAFPPPVAEAIGLAVYSALHGVRQAPEDLLPLALVG